MEDGVDDPVALIPSRYFSKKDEDEARDSIKTDFVKDGFLTIDRLIDPTFAGFLGTRLEDVLRGRYSTGIPPDKVPKKVKGKGLLGFSGNPIKRTLQIINIWKSDTAFARLVKSPRLGEIVARLGSASSDAWKSGARVAQDQVWAKPPGASALVFHRDSPYFDFIPENVITVWIALDDMTDEVGPLEYVRGSHCWNAEGGRSGSATAFFQTKRRALLDSAAKREGIDPSTLSVVTVNVSAGGAGVHDGRTWHGSGPNRSPRRPRRGIGIHFVPANVRWKSTVGPLWARLRKQGRENDATTGCDDDDAVSESLFPVTFRPRHEVDSRRRDRLPTPPRVEEIASARKFLKDRVGLHLTSDAVTSILVSRPLISRERRRAKAKIFDETATDDEHALLRNAAVKMDLRVHGAPMLRPSQYRASSASFHVERLTVLQVIGTSFRPRDLSKASSQDDWSDALMRSSSGIDRAGRDADDGGDDVVLKRGSGERRARTIAFDATDGHTRCRVVEWAPCPELAISRLVPGVKIRLKAGALVRQGVVLLTPETFEFIEGGRVDALSKEWKLELDAERRGRLQQWFASASSSTPWDEHKAPPAFRPFSSARLGNLREKKSRAGTDSGSKKPDENRKLDKTNETFEKLSLAARTAASTVIERVAKKRAEESGVEPSTNEKTAEHLTKANLSIGNSMNITAEANAKEKKKKKKKKRKKNKRDGTEGLVSTDMAATRSRPVVVHFADILASPDHRPREGLVRARIADVILLDLHTACAEPHLVVRLSQDAHDRTDRRRGSGVFVSAVCGRQLRNMLLSVKPPETVLELKQTIRGRERIEKRVAALKAALTRAPTQMFHLCAPDEKDAGIRRKIRHLDGCAYVLRNVSSAENPAVRP